MQDFFGNELKVGDTVAFIYDRFHYRDLHKGEITGFTPKQVRISFIIEHHESLGQQKTIRNPKSIVKNMKTVQHCKELVFHFNKHSIVNPDVPAWVIKTKGETFYVKHLECSAPWSTKETPDNSHTKGSLKFKNVDLTIEENVATIVASK